MQPIVCQFLECHTSTLPNLRVTRTEVSSIMMMNSVVVTTSASLTQFEMFCNLLKRMLRINFLVEVDHLTPECSVFGESNALGLVNFYRTHLECFVSMRVEYPELSDMSRGSVTVR